MKRKLRSEILDTLVDRMIVMDRVEMRGDSVLTRWQVSGRNDRGIPLLGISPNGRRLHVTVRTIDRLEHDAVVRTVYVDASEVYRQLNEGGGERRSA